MRTPRRTPARYVRMRARPVYITQSAHKISRQKGFTIHLPYVKMTGIKDKLKPCPFCGGEAKLLDMEFVEMRYEVICPQCHISTMLFKEEQKAIAEWNRRV